MNSVFLSGNLTKDPTLRYTKNQTEVANFSIAVNEWSKGNKYTTYADITAWRKLAINVAAQLVKGQRVTVTGRLRNETWTDNQGNTRYSTSIVADEVVFGPAPRSNGEHDEPVDQSEFVGPAPTPEDPGYVPERDGEIEIPELVMVPADPSEEPF